MEPHRSLSWLDVLGTLKRTLWTQISALLALSLVLGLAFNSANPIGIRWGAGDAPPKPAGSAPAEAVVAVTAPAPLPMPLIVPTPLLTTGESGVHGGLADLESKFPTMAWVDVKPLLTSGAVAVVDARGAPTFDAGHIPGALSLPESSTVGEFRAFAVRQPPATPLVIYCGNSACDASAKLADILSREYGYHNIRLMSGGYAEYQRLELGYDPTPTRVAWAEVQPLIDQSKVILVDARSRASYDAGHIPGAISLPEASAEDAFREFQRQHPADAHVVVYCTDLRCSMSMRVAIKLATWYQFRKVQFMPGGYQEWQQAQPGSPKS